MGDGDVDAAERERGQALVRLELGQVDAQARVVVRAGPASFAGSSARVAVGKEASRTLPVSSAALATSEASARSSAASTSCAWGSSCVRGVGQADAAAVALDQRAAGLALERAELLRDRGRRVTECVGGAGDAAVGGDLAQDEQAARVEHRVSDAT